MSEVAVALSGLSRPKKGNRKGPSEEGRVKGAEIEINNKQLGNREMRPPRKRVGILHVILFFSEGQSGKGKGREACSQVKTEEDGDKRRQNQLKNKANEKVRSGRETCPQAEKHDENDLAEFYVWEEVDFEEVFGRWQKGKGWR